MMVRAALPALILGATASAQTHPDLNCVGSEPSWSLELGQSHATYIRAMPIRSPTKYR